MQPLIHYVLGPLKRRIVTPALTWAGDMLEHVPEQWRPPIRTRDRLAKRLHMEGNPSARRSPLLSPIGLEPVVNDPGPEPGSASEPRRSTSRGSSRSREWC
jgi:hypothetical protein